MISNPLDQYFLTYQKENTGKIGRPNLNAPTQSVTTRGTLISNGGYTERKKKGSPNEIHISF